MRKGSYDDTSRKREKENSKVLQKNETGVRKWI